MESYCALYRNFLRKIFFMRFYRRMKETLLEQNLTKTFCRPFSSARRRLASLSTSLRPLLPPTHPTHLPTPPTSLSYIIFIFYNLFFFILMNTL